MGQVLGWALYPLTVVGAGMGEGHRGEHQEPWWGQKLGGSLGEEESYREVSLVDAQEKDQLGQAQGSCEVASDAVLVGAEGTEEGEEEEGERQGG